MGFGILSTGSIANHFAGQVKGSSKLHVAAVASRSLDSATAFAEKHGIAHAYGSYAELLDDPTVQIVYIGLPNSLHTEWCLRALEAGKHVLCEKPLTGSPQEARLIHQTAQKLGLHVAEAYPYRAQPQTVEMLRIIESGELGLPLSIQGSFGFKLENQGDIRLDPALAGGALMDAGAYPLSLVRAIAGAYPEQVQAFKRQGPRGTDTAVIANLAFRTGLMAQISCSFHAAAHRYAVIACEGGVIETSYANSTPDNQPTTLRIKRGSGFGATFETVSLPAVDAFRVEAESFVDQVLTGKPWIGVSSHESVDVAALLEHIAKVAVDVGGRSFG
ncbi:hypothetical protein ABE85_09590 [Mitsuaria sp. 7]|nr:hypothetical protein ABE85_09590 [Mitsuaria sp. 7]